MRVNVGQPVELRRGPDRQRAGRAVHRRLAAERPVAVRDRHQLEDRQRHARRAGSSTRPAGRAGTSSPSSPARSVHVSLTGLSSDDDVFLFTDISSAYAALAERPAADSDAPQRRIRIRRTSPTRSRRTRSRPMRSRRMRSRPMPSRRNAFTSNAFTSNALHVQCASRSQRVHVECVHVERLHVAMRSRRNAFTSNAFTSQCVHVERVHVAMPSRRLASSTRTG